MNIIDVKKSLCDKSVYSLLAPSVFNPTSERLHHEIYMSDARKVAPEKWKTVIRHPIRKA